MNMKTMVIAIGILLGFCAGIHFYAEWQKQEFDTSLPKPPVPEQQVADDVTDDAAAGHWHGDEWHAEPHKDGEVASGPPIRPIQGKIVQTSNPLTSKEELQAEAYREYYKERWGEDLPPEGYRHIRDKEGNVHLIHQDEPFIQIHETIGFAPTRAQYERYKQLQTELSAAEASGDTTQANQIDAELKQLVTDAQGTIPTVSSLSIGRSGESIEALERRMAEHKTAALKAAYQEYGLGHLADDLE